MSLPSPTGSREGGLIDRSRRPFASASTAEQLTGHPGDTLASALLANGVRLVGRSFKYHRPRGILTAGSEEPNALVELRTGARREPNTRATTIELYDGLDAASQNRWPSLQIRRAGGEPALLAVPRRGLLLQDLHVAAPRFWEKLYEPAIRRAAGLGRAADAPDPDHYEKANAFCDVLVIGAGPAGLAAALAAAQVRGAGDPVRGGFPPRRTAARGALRRSTARRRATGWRRLRPSSRRLPECRILRRTTVHGVYDGGTYAAIERVNDHVASAAGARAAPAALEDRGQARGARGGRDRAADRVRRQRPARRDAGRRGARLRQPLWRGAGTARGGLRRQ